MIKIVICFFLSISFVFGQTSNSSSGIQAIPLTAEQYFTAMHEGDTTGLASFLQADKLKKELFARKKNKNNIEAASMFVAPDLLPEKVVFQTNTNYDGPQVDNPTPGQRYTSYYCPHCFPLPDH